VHARALDELRQLDASSSATLCGQPIAVGSFIGPSSIIDTNSRTMKLSSSVVTTSSTPKRVFANCRQRHQDRAGEHRGRDHRGEQDRRRQVEGRTAVQAADGDRGERARVELALARRCCTGARETRSPRRGR
jgi:hypothetical protein